MLTQTPDGVLLSVHAVPGSSRFEIVGREQWTDRLKVKLKNKAMKGKANQELTARLSEVLKTEVTLASGHSSSKKILLIRGKTINEVLKSLSK